MPDLQNFSVVRTGGTVNVNVPVWRIEFDITDSSDGRVLRSFRGANGFSFPQAFSTFTAVQQDELVGLLVQAMIRMKAPDLFS